MKLFKNGIVILILGLIGVIAVVGTAVFSYLSYEREPRGSTPQEIAGMNLSRVNINTASAEELAALPSLTKAQAQSIVDDREENGSFDTAEEVIRVKGIGKATYEKIALYITAE